MTQTCLQYLHDDLVQGLCDSIRSGPTRLQRKRRPRSIPIQLQPERRPTASRSDRSGFLKWEAQVSQHESAFKTDTLIE